MIVAGIPLVVAARTPDGGGAAAEAIRTTDTHRKETLVPVGDTGAVVGGMAKGAAMLAPNMATMLAVLTTDAAAEPNLLRQILRSAISTSFNVLMTDACRSTNDTVILLASGLAGPVPPADLAAAVGKACGHLAAQMAGDAEGATKVVRLTVSGVATDADAEAGARQIARSALCSAPGTARTRTGVGWPAGSAVPESTSTRPVISVAYGGVTLAAGGVTIDHDAEAVASHMGERHLDITCDLGLAEGTFTVLTNDLTHEYIDENTGGS